MIQDLIRQEVLGSLLGIFCLVRIEPRALAAPGDRSELNGSRLIVREIYASSCNIVSCNKLLISSTPDQGIDSGSGGLTFEPAYLASYRNIRLITAAQEYGQEG